MNYEGIAALGQQFKGENFKVLAFPVSQYFDQVRELQYSNQPQSIPNNPN
eukprot:SAG31_NODE_963_length_10710_cov_332.216285_6_plen_50_part_00